MIKLNKHGLISKRLIAQEFAIGSQALIEETYGDDMIALPKEKLPRNASDDAKWDANIIAAEKLLDEIDKAIALLP